ncbi:MAG: nicotinate (nicotinamide) nucleotide adenylyltransferase, partial [Pseudoflavonifractor sp.]
MKIGIYGGTFNPPHLGHMTSAAAAMAALELDKLFLIPAALPPHKQLPADAPAAADRVAMAALMADGIGQSLARPDDVTALDMELCRGGKSYTADTLAELHARYPEDALWLLMGADMFLTVQDWYEPQKIMSLAGLAAFARTEEDCGTLLEEQAEYLRRQFGAEVNLVQLPNITDISSTRLRALLAAGEGAEYLWQPVYGYILRQGLYGAGKDLKNLSDEDLRCASYSMIRAKRIAHVRGTEQAAVALAERWGADVAHARRAAILHDCTKYLGMAEQRKICQEYGIALDALEQGAVKLLHAKTGACLARGIYGAPDDIYEAIFWHTTGKA